MRAIAKAVTRQARPQTGHGIPAVPQPIIADIQRFSLDNGPGIRTTVFFKGCNLRCAWCHNPELQEPSPQVAFLADRCLDCRSCVAVCNDAPNSRRPDDRCSGCGRCASACPTGALRMMGTRMEPDRLAALLLEDLPFYRASGGGVTFSGGEPGLFGRYCALTAAILKTRGVHVALQTAGFFPWEEFARTILPLTDHIYFDLKTANAATHQRLTGQPLAPILANLRRLAASSVPLTATLVLVPGVNDDPKTIAALRGLAHQCGVTRLITRPYVAEHGAKRWRIVTVPLRHRREQGLAGKTLPRSTAA